VIRNHKDYWGLNPEEEAGSVEQRPSGRVDESSKDDIEENKDADFVFDFNSRSKKKNFISFK
jgi:hypothetical protein